MMPLAGAIGGILGGAAGGLIGKKLYKEPKYRAPTLGLEGQRSLEAMDRSVGYLGDRANRSVDDYTGLQMGGTEAGQEFLGAPAPNPMHEDRSLEDAISARGARMYGSERSKLQRQTAANAPLMKIHADDVYQKARANQGAVYARKKSIDVQQAKALQEFELALDAQRNAVLAGFLGSVGGLAGQGLASMTAKGA